LRGLDAGGIGIELRQQPAIPKLRRSVPWSPLREQDVALHGAMRGLRVAGFQCYKDIGVLANRFFCHARVKQQPREMHVGMQAGERLGV
jgi:hypothetical protein